MNAPTVESHNATRHYVWQNSAKTILISETDTFIRKPAQFTATPVFYDGGRRILIVSACMLPLEQCFLVYPLCKFVVFEHGPVNELL